MSTDTPDIVVLQEKAHGVPSDQCVRTLRDQLPDYEVRLARTPDEERAFIEMASVVVGIDIDEALLKRADRLRLFACASAGLDHIPLDLLAKYDVAVTNASGVHPPNIAEHVLACLLAFARRLPTAWRLQQRRQWRHFGAFDGLTNSTVTIVGLGTIGREVTAMLDGFDVETVGARYTPSKGGPTDEVVGIRSDAFYEALGRTDYLVLACQLTDATRGLIGRRAFRALSPEAVLVNVARGAVIDTDELLAALRDPAGTHIRGAALDVTEPEPLPENHPLWTLDNVIITPHMAGNNPQYWANVGEILVRNLRQVEETGEYTDLENQVLP